MVEGVEESVVRGPETGSKNRKRRHESTGSDDNGSSRQSFWTKEIVAVNIPGQLLHDPQPTVTVYLGDVLHPIPQSMFLSHVWGDGLDSECMVCKKPFQTDGAPPIRTIGFEFAKALPVIPVDITQTVVTPYHIRIYNRHFACIEAKNISYIPVSHVWYEDVATAQDNRMENIDVSRIVYQTVVRSLLAVTQKYGNSEIWHDYMSVPQWRREVQQQLLLSIPTIYNYPKTAMIHLHDVQAVNLDGIQGVTVSNIHEMSQYTKFVDSLSAITSSRWFERMWVTLEYMQSNEIIILANDFSICSMSAREISLRIDDVATECIKSHGNSKFTSDLRERNCHWTRIVSWGDMETWKSRQDKLRTLGFAMGILGRRNCREERDYYLALGAMLDFKPKQTPLILIQDTFQYFLSLAHYTLEMGDYTPLLFTPLTDEKVDPRAPWLYGYSKVSGKFWDLGVCHKRAKSQQIIRNGKIVPELESVGVIEMFEYYDFDGAPTEVFDHVASNITRASGICPKAFCSAVDRVFTRLERKGLYTEWENEISNNSMDPEQEYDLAKLGRLLNEYVILQNRADSQQSSQQRSGLLEQMITFLNLERRGEHNADCRFSVTSAEAEWYHEEYGKYMEGIGRVSCKFCGQRSIFRLTSWETPTPEISQVYRIPGLLYDETIPEGVGLVVSGQRIIGKMSYGTPACECHKLELVELGSCDIAN